VGGVQPWVAALGEEWGLLGSRHQQLLWEMGGCISVVDSGEGVGSVGTWAS